MKATKFLKELQKVQKQAEGLEKNYPNNSLWKGVNEQLKSLVDDVKSDIKIYGYD